MANYLFIQVPLNTVPNPPFPNTDTSEKSCLPNTNGRMISVSGEISNESLESGGVDAESSLFGFRS